MYIYTWDFPPAETVAEDNYEVVAGSITGFSAAVLSLTDTDDRCSVSLGTVNDVWCVELQGIVVDACRSDSNYKIYERLQNVTTYRLL